MQKNILSLLLLAALWTSGQAQWQALPPVFNETMYRICFYNEKSGFLAGKQHLYKTLDGGQTWSKVDTSLGYIEALTITANQLVFFADYSSSTPYRTRGIRKSTNFGATWTTVDTNQAFYAEIEFPSPNVGYAAGASMQNKPLMRKSIDGGNTWTLLPANFKPSKYEIQGISFIDDNRGWAVSYDGYLFATTDGGQKWTVQDSVRDASKQYLPMRDIQFVSADTGFAVGGVGGQMVIASTVNGGKKWDIKITNGASLVTLAFLNSKIGWITGSGLGMDYWLARTDDGGKTWKSQIAGLTDLMGVYSICTLWDRGSGSMTGYALAAFGIKKTYRVLKTLQTTAVFDRPVHAPSELALWQNYPNPFNASTTISFSLPRPGKIELEVFDLRGNKICTIAQGPFAAGHHAISWVADNLPSGVYLYRLTAGGQEQSRKFILIK